ncbi:hypothetical protein B0T21DRAFT_351282 [Apiosordaria backusii]|uniref:Uncharacterized protein n=1 Tax=Apiosordaria backusii TaxID=314023 RepID=A0AA40ASW0_9PEZI|nr:hypothetical protein B0T21DRAFT_351282 [Apiosordaria backusii]
MDAQDVTDFEEMENTIWSTNRLYLCLLETFPNYVQDFQAKWNDWQQAISAKDSSTWSSVPSFTTLTTLGPKIIPLVVYQLALNQNDNTAVHLYTTLETNPFYLPGPPAEVGSSRALQILRLSFDRNRAVRNALADWAEYSERVSRHSTSTMYTECAEYDTLLGFGQSIIPQVMLQYAHDIKVQSGGGGVLVSASGIGRGLLFWYELLHELVWGGKTGVQTVEFEEMYKRWEAWFQGGGGVEDAPRFGRQAA